jgi:hypothetical protein
MFKSVIVTFTILVLCLSAQAAVTIPTSKDQSTPAPSKEKSAPTPASPFANLQPQDQHYQAPKTPEYIVPSFKRPEPEIPANQRPFVIQQPVAAPVPAKLKPAVAALIATPLPGEPTQPVAAQVPAKLPQAVAALIAAPVPAKPTQPAAPADFPLDQYIATDVFSGEDYYKMPFAPDIGKTDSQIYELFEEISQDLTKNPANRETYIPGTILRIPKFDYLKNILKDTAGRREVQDLVYRTCICGKFTNTNIQDEFLPHKGCTKLLKENMEAQCPPEAYFPQVNELYPLNNEIKKEYSLPKPKVTFNSNQYNAAVEKIKKRNPGRYDYLCKGIKNYGCRATCKDLKDCEFDIKIKDQLNIKLNYPAPTERPVSKDDKSLKISTKIDDKDVQLICDVEFPQNQEYECRANCLTIKGTDGNPDSFECVYDYNEKGKPDQKVDFEALDGSGEVNKDSKSVTAKALINNQEVQLTCIADVLPAADEPAVNEPPVNNGYVCAKAVCTKKDADEGGKAAYDCNYNIQRKDEPGTEVSFKFISAEQPTGNDGEEIVLRASVDDKEIPGLSCPVDIKGNEKEEEDNSGKYECIKAECTAVAAPKAEEKMDVSGYTKPAAASAKFSCNYEIKEKGKEELIKITKVTSKPIATLEQEIGGKMVPLTCPMTMKEDPAKAAALSAIDKLTPDKPLPNNNSGPRPLVPPMQQPLRMPSTILLPNGNI